MRYFASQFVNLDVGLTLCFDDSMRNHQKQPHEDIQAGYAPRTRQHFFYQHKHIENVQKL